MSIRFSADEIFEMAQQIERNGAKFYRKAAEGVAASRSRNLLLDFAAMEDDHEKTFGEMRRELSARERQTPVFDPTGESALYLRAMADGYVFNVREDPSERLTGKETLEQVVQTAIGLEKDSVVFYLQMKEMVPGELGKGRIDGIIKQELGHIAHLNQQLGEPG